MLQVPPVDDWQAAYVSSAVNKAANDDPSLVEPIDPPTDPTTPVQGSLF